MATNYPSALDTFTNPSGTSLVTTIDHAAQHSDANDAIEALQATLGTTAGTSVVYKLSEGEFTEKEGNLTFGENTYSLGEGALSQGNALTYNGTEIVGSASGGGDTSPLTTKGDIYIYSTEGTRLPLGTDGYVLQVGTAQASGLQWVNTLNGLTLGTPVIDQIASSGTATPTTVNQGLAPTVSTVSDSAGGTLSFNAAAAQVFEVNFGTTAGNRTFSSLANPTDGQAISFRVKQNSGDTGTVVWDSVYRFSSNIGTPGLGTASTWNYFGYRYNETDTKWDFQGQSLNVI